MVRLKTIKSREDIFCYLSSYLHCSFLWQFVIVTFTIASSSAQADAETSGRRVSRWLSASYWISENPSRCGDLCSYRRAIRTSASHWIIESSSCCGEALGHRGVKSFHHQIVVKWSYRCRHRVVIQKWCITSVSTPNLILSECLVDDGCLHLSSVNFSYKRTNHLSGCRRWAALITLSRRRFD